MYFSKYSLAWCMLLTNNIMLIPRENQGLSQCEARGLEDDPRRKMAANKSF